MVPKDLTDLRKEYSISQLDENRVASNPMNQFDLWMKDALSAGVPEPNAMCLSTSTSDGRPSSRIVLLKEYNKDGFVFYTNYQSKKGLEIAQNPYGALNFFWIELERQVRIEGYLERTDAKTSDEYFSSRPRGSQIGAWTSPQSQNVANRELMENRYSEIEQRFKNKDVPRPAQWGGYLLIPDMIEFWQGRPNRLHDRIQYSIDKDNWIIRRLAP